MYDSGSEVVPVTTPATASVVTATGTVAEHWPVTVAKIGTTGGTVSFTTTVWFAVLLLPFRSSNLQ